MPTVPPDVANSVGSTTRSAAALVLGLVVAGTVLRLVGLGEKSYWGDEVATILVLEHRFVDVLSAVAATQNTPPLYYLVAWPWATIFGTSEIALRSLSTMFSVALIPLAYLVGTQLLARRVGLVAAALVATNPLLVWYAQEAKAYALFVLLSGLSFLFFLRAIDKPTRGLLAAWGTSCALAVATHYFGVFLFAVEALWLLRLRHTNTTVMMAAALPALTGLALLPLAYRQGDPNWLQEMSLMARVVKTPAIFLIGFETPAKYAVSALAAALCVMGIWMLLARSTPLVRRRGLFALGVGTMTYGMAAVVAVAGADYFFYRNVIAALLPILVGLACGFGASDLPRLGLSAFAVLCLLSVGVVLITVSLPKFGKEDWRNAASTLRDGLEKAIVLTPHGSDVALSYYLAGRTSLLEGPGAQVAEIVLVGAATRPMGSIIDARPPQGPTPAPPEGFELERRIDARYYTVITYRAPTTRWVVREQLLALAMDAQPTLMVERP